MTIARETVYQALFDKVSSAAGFVTKSRRWQHFDNVPAPMQPAIFQTQDPGSDATTIKLQPTKWTWRVDLYVYAHQGDETKSISEVMNPLLDAIEAALRPDPATGAQTLGGLVSHCWIEGKVEEYDGSLVNQGVAVIPVAMLITGNQ